MNRNVLRTFIVGCMALLAVPAGAATLYIEPNTTEISPGDTLALAVRLDTEEGECVNVVSGVIEYTGTILPVDISRGNSIMPIWVEDPVIDKGNKQITFAGGIPNGYCGRIIGDPKLTNVIMEILVQAPGLQIGIGDSSPTSTVAFTDQTEVLLNDGAGTQAQLQAFGSEIFVNKKPSGDVTDEWLQRIVDDNREPRDFEISLESDKSIFAGRYFITFNTTDKQSGLDHYEVIEEPIDDFDLFGWGAVGAPWKEVRSPYVLKDQTLNSTIRVKAVDKAGNEYIAVLVPPEDLRGETTRDKARIGLYFAGAIMLLVLVVSFVFYRRKTAQYEQEDEGLDE